MNLGYVGMACALGLSAIGSALGAAAACAGAVGGWKKCYVEGKPAPFILVAFGGVPLTQTIYGFLLMTFIKSALAGGCDQLLGLAVGVFCGLAIGTSAWQQGRIAAASCDSFAETGKGAANDFMVIGIVETVALFAMVFGLIALG